MSKPANPRRITTAQVSSWLRPRPQDSHKAMFGTVAVIGGAAGMLGASLLAARAALKLGAGCVHVGLLAEQAPIVDFVQPELMLHPAREALHLPGITALAVGCGLGKTKPAQMILVEALQRPLPLVLDADALNLLASHDDLQDDLRKRQAATVLTPHPGEAARLLGCSTADIQADRLTAIRRLAQQFGCSIVLKGAHSLCATTGGKLYVNHTGNPGMSSAGMGDVLTGMIAAFIAQGMEADQALLLAVHLHGATGDALAQQGIRVGLSASELTDWARWLLNQWHS